MMDCLSVFLVPLLCASFINGERFPYTREFDRQTEVVDAVFIVSGRAHVFFPAGLELQVVTIATEETDGYKRFMSAAGHFDIQVEVKQEAVQVPASFIFV